MITTAKEKKVIEYGDYQTPLEFTKSVCAKLKELYHLSPSIIIEPTFGIGNFIESAISEFNTIKTVYGMELNKEYFLYTSERISSQKSKCNINLHHTDIFSFNFSEIKNNISVDDDILVIGNPPWVTNSSLSSLYSHNMPKKSNFKGYSGIDAIIGKGNFDIAEYIILQMLNEFSDYNCTVAMLCKTIVAKNIIRDTHLYKFNITKADMFVFDAYDIFNANCDAALLIIKIGNKNNKTCNVYDYYTNEKKHTFGWQEEIFYSNIPENHNIKNIAGKCQFEWRQGIKHDCSKVMELKHLENSKFINGFGETVNLTPGQHLFPLIKSSNIKSNEINHTDKYVIVTQKKINADTSTIKTENNNLWQYLLHYEDKLKARRSVIYKKSPKFSIFGIGDYSFAKYKVGISGFYKEPVFALINGEYNIMLDDTCYFLGFDNISHAVITTALLNSSICLSFLKSIAFQDSKRPYTKEVLKQIDLLKLINLLPYDYICNFAKSMKGQYIITEQQYSSFKNSLKPTK